MSAPQYIYQPPEDESQPAVLSSWGSSSNGAINVDLKNLRCLAAVPCPRKRHILGIRQNGVVLHAKGFKTVNGTVRNAL